MYLDSLVINWPLFILSETIFLNGEFGCFLTPVSSPIHAGCTTIKFNSVITDLELEQTLQGKGSVQQVCPYIRPKSQVSGQHHSDQLTMNGSSHNILLQCS